MNFADVIIRRKAKGMGEALTYEIPPGMTAGLGSVVRVPFGKTEEIGVVFRAHENAPALENLKALREVTPLTLEPHQLMLTESIARYYRTTPAQALSLFLPPFLEKKNFQAPGKLKIILPPALPLKEPAKTLTRAQEEALAAIGRAGKPVLLHGVTGSGKTEIYLRIILEALRQGRQALLLVPEIALTPQTIAYFKDFLGEHLAVFHSKATDLQRCKEWWKVKSGMAPLVIGSRSAIFAPFSHLGALIIDEEHEWTYKQEQAPHYETQKIAEEMARHFGCPLVLASATPRAESFFKAHNGEYLYLNLPARVNDSAMPPITVVDLRDEFKKRNFSLLSLALQHKIRERLAAKDQIILFVNQRGLARAVACRDCGQTETCPKCEISLKLHREGNSETLLCHYCAFRKAPPLACAHCGSVYIKSMGVGTQRVEEEMTRLFPEARLLRADQDTTKGPGGFERLYHDFRDGKADVLIGTQMIAKGLDFERVTLVGILCADIGLHIPDFRSHERLFQLTTQVAGRCGRGEKPGEVILQTYQPGHFAIDQASRYAYDDFMRQELKFRQSLGYPPYRRMVKFTVVGTDLEKLQKQLQAEKETLEGLIKTHGLEARVTTAPAMIARMAGRYYYHLLLTAADLTDFFSRWTPPPTWRMDIDPLHTA